MRILSRTVLAIVVAAVAFVGLPPASASAPTAGSIAKLDDPCRYQLPIVAKKSFRVGGKRIGVGYLALGASGAHSYAPGACSWFLPDRKYRKAPGTVTMRFDFSKPGRDDPSVLAFTSPFRRWRTCRAGMVNGTAGSGWIATSKITVRYGGRKQKTVLSAVFP